MVTKIISVEFLLITSSEHSDLWRKISNCTNQNKLEEHGLLRKAKLYEIQEDDVIKFKRHLFPSSVQLTVSQIHTELL